MSEKFAVSLWLDGQIEECVQFYLNIFQKTSRNKTTYYVDDLHGKAGDILSCSITLDGLEFVLVNGGPEFSQTPAVSYMIEAPSVSQLETLWHRLKHGGTILEPLEKKADGLSGWLTDQYGTSWLLRHGSAHQTITPCLLFSGKNYGNAKHATEIYSQVFGRANLIFSLPNEEGHWRMAKIHLVDQAFYLVDTRSVVPGDFSMANSFIYYCDGQREINRIWKRFIEFQGTEYPCGWLTDKFGLAWQIIPEKFDELFELDDAELVKKVTHAMYAMKRLDYDELLKIAQITDDTEKIR